MKTSYRERDYAFGQSMLTLRSAVGLTQAGLASHLGVSRRAVGEWEMGSSYPKAEHLKAFIALAVQQQVFPKGSAAEEIRALWKAAHQKTWLDERWLAGLLEQGVSPKSVPVSMEESQSSARVIAHPASGPRVDWGDALTVPFFYGREEELAFLSQWVMDEHCHLVSIWGLGGIGKSVLAIHFMHQVVASFEVVIFRSLRDALSCETLLDQCLRVLSPQALGVMPDTLEQRIGLLLEYMRQTKVLIVLDNLESLLEEGDVRGNLRPGFEGYGQLLQKVAERDHQSCLLFTSREKLAGLRPLEGKHSPIRSLRLTGLGVSACKQIFAEKELVGSEAAQEHLIDMYGGNPLVLKIAAETIVDLLGGDIGEFLSSTTGLFGSITDLLDEQFARLSELEQSVLCWLAIMREPVNLDKLLDLLVIPLSHIQLLEAVDSLYRRSLIERGKYLGSFTLQSVVLEYVTAFLIAEASSEIQRGQLDRLIQHGLCLAYAKEYVRETQERLLLSPLLADLQCVYLERADKATGLSSLEKHLLALLNQFRQLAETAQGYGPANLIALLQLQRGNLNGLDLSRLCIRGAYLQSIEMQDSSMVGTLTRDCVFTRAVSAIWGVAISLDGKRWATGSFQGQVRIWEGVQFQTLRLTWQAHLGLVQALAFSPDGHTLVSGGRDSTVKMWEVESGRLLWTGEQYNPLSLAFTPDGTLLASGDMDGTVRFWDVQSGRNLQIVTHPSRVHVVAFSPDGCLLASGCVNGEMRLWERQEVSPLTYKQILAVQTNWIASLAFAPDGRILASTSMGDSTVKLWEVASLHLLHTLPGHLDQSRCVTWSPDGRTLAYSGSDNSIWLWDVEQGRCRAVLYGHTACISSMVFTPDSSSLLSSDEDSTLRVWDVDICRCVHVIAGYGFSLVDINWSPDGTQLVSGSTNGLVTIWDLNNGRSLLSLYGHTRIVCGVGWSPDGGYLASCGLDRVVLLWDSCSFSCVHRFQNPEAVFLCMAWNPKGCQLACGSYLRGILVWDVTAGDLRWIGQTELTAFHHVAWSPNGAQLVGIGDDGYIYVWKSTDGTLQKKFSGHHGWVMGVVWSPDGKQLASSSSNGELFVWDIESGERAQTFVGCPGLVSVLAWSPDGKWLINGNSNGMLRWWDMGMAKCVYTQEAHQGTIQALKVSPDGKSLASCGDDGAIRIWNLNSHEHLRTLRHDRPYERLNITGIKGLDESHKSSLLALGAFEK
jgi:WD40 repeat protein/transcriptional regulator with XRE-family HTH domain